LFAKEIETATNYRDEKGGYVDFLGRRQSEIPLSISITLGQSLLLVVKKIVSKSYRQQTPSSTKNRNFSYYPLIPPIAPSANERRFPSPAAYRRVSQCKVLKSSRPSSRAAQRETGAHANAGRRKWAKTRFAVSSSESFPTRV